MAAPKIIGPIPRSTPADLASTRGAMPDDLLRVASRRVAICSLLGAGLWVLGDVLGNLSVRADGGPALSRLGMADLISLISVVVSLAVYFYARRRAPNPRLILNLGVAYVLYTSVALGQLIHLSPVLTHMAVSPMISWIGVTVLLYAAIVPSSPRKTLIAGLIAVCMNPLGMLVARWRGLWDFGPTVNVLLMHYPDFIVVGAAAVVSHVVTRLGREVSKAREMGSYQLGALLGRGGMGEVYEATHRMLARPAAIKLIRPETLGAGSSPAARTAVIRFRREAEAAANLQSPHTVALYDFGVTEDQTLYFVMELLHGMDLDALVAEKGPLSAGRTIFILRQVCDSLAEAHARGLVHRDIKPANLHVGRFGLHHDWVKVLDFGLVKSTEGTGTESSQATATGLTPGTPAYMAPEIALGDPVDGRADIYALGCVGYFLLTGQTVFAATAPMQMIAMHLRETPEPPSQRTELPVPEALDRLILDCLAKSPADRPASAAEVAARLAAIAADPWGEEQAERWWRVNRPS